MLEWKAFKSLLSDTPYSYIDTGYKYIVTTANNTCEIIKTKNVIPGSPQEDFENNYKANAITTINPTSDDGKRYIRAESRPLDMTTCFTCRGDSSSKVGGGTKLMWDASVDTFTDVDDNFKRIIIDFGFNSDICIKEGTLYFFDADWYGELAMWTYVPAAYHPSGQDTFVDNFVVSQFFYGSCPMGDELNTECASSKIPPYIRHQLWITIPKTDTTCKGYVSLELYRGGTV